VVERAEAADEVELAEIRGEVRHVALDVEQVEVETLAAGR
jgi:hypothetical protein